jgi:hypothetical protein
MKGIPTIKLKPIKAGLLGRKALLLGAATLMVAGTATLAASTNAFAALGTGPGVTLTPASGATTTTPGWSTNAGCPSGDNGSGALYAVAPDGVTVVQASGADNSVTGPITSGPALLGSMATIQSVVGTPNGGTMEVVLLCFPNPSLQGSTGTPTIDTFVTFSADGTQYTTGTPATATTTTLTVQPTTVTVGNSVTLTATVKAGSGTADPTGTVTFMNGTTAIGSPVTLTAGTTAGTATATTSTSPTAAGTESLTAVYSPSGTTFSGSTSAAVTLTVTSLAGQAIPLAVTVPPQGAFTLTVDTTDTVTLAVSGSTATGATTPITVSDTRNTFPGWAVSGQSTDFTESTTTPAGDISGNQLGWVPTSTALGTGVLLGPTVAPGSPGLGTTPAILAQAHAPNGTGTSTLGANLTLDIPALAPAAAYKAALSITAATSNA